MKLTCPRCAAKYTIADERLNGRRVKVRCKRCGEAFAVDLENREEMCTPGDRGGQARIRKDDRRAPSADLFAGVATAGGEEVVVSVSVPEETTLPAATGAAPLLGERNENSVLFSLASLGVLGASPRDVAGTTTTESSALIDIRALCGADAKPDHHLHAAADDIINLSGGGAFASPLLAPLPVTLLPVEEGTAPMRSPQPRTTLLFIGAISLVVATTSVVAITHVRGASATASAMTAETSAPSSIASALPTVLSTNANAPPTETAATPNAPPRATSSTRALVAITTPATTTTTTTSTASVARALARTSDAPPTSSAASTASTTTTTSAAAAKCCAGETETTCHMRLSVGAPCGDAPATSMMTTAPSFDRPAAARALGMNVSSCKRPDGPTGSGHARVTFQPSGAVSAVDLDAPYAGTAVGACVAQRYRNVSVPAFAGSALSVGKTFAIQ